MKKRGMKMMDEWLGFVFVLHCGVAVALAVSVSTYSVF